jgi:hypothetical protein
MRSDPVASPYVEQARAIAKFDPGMSPLPGRDFARSVVDTTWLFTLAAKRYPLHRQALDERSVFGGVSQLPPNPTEVRVDPAAIAFRVLTP